MPPPTQEKWKEIAKDFWEIQNFPNCLGALDGKHVIIQAPSNSGSEYFNYKKSFSIVLMALVDANYKFIMVDVGAYGKNSDGGIFAHSAMGNRFEKKTLNVPSDTFLPGTEAYVIVGDEAFALKPYLLRPYPGKCLDTDDKRIYNYRLSRARRVVENAFGILTRFRIFNRRIQVKPQYADFIILATCVLHNFIKETDNNYTTNLKDNTNSNQDQTALQNINVRGENST